MTATVIPPAPTDAALIAAAQGGDREAFGHLVTRFQRRIWRVCRQYVGPGEADVACQETLIKAFTRLRAFDGRAAFSTWITRIAINTCLDLIRKHRREAGFRISDRDEEAPALEVPDDRADPEERARQRQAIANLLAAEQRLSDRQREVFRLRFFADLSIEAIAGTLGVHPGTVKTLLHRAVHRLRTELEASR